MFVGVFQAIRGVKNDLDQKMSFVLVHPLMKSGQKGASQGEPLGINFFGLSMHFPHQLGKRDGKINWIGRSDQFGAFWATLLGEESLWSVAWSGLQGPGKTHFQNLQGTYFLSAD